MEDIGDRDYVKETRILGIIPYFLNEIKHTCVQIRNISLAEKTKPWYVDLVVDCLNMTGYGGSGFPSNLAIVGNNGSGKTTLTKLLLGLYTPSTGTIFYNGIAHNEIRRSMAKGCDCKRHLPHWEFSGFG